MSRGGVLLALTADSYADRLSYLRVISPRMSDSFGTGPSDSLQLAIQVLYSLTLEAVGDVPRGSAIAATAGRKFEDDAADAAYTTLVDHGVHPPTPPRHRLELPTLSGLYQQFDLVVKDHLRYCVVELKRRSQAEIEQVYAFVAKLLDYALAAKIYSTDHTFTGIFVSTSPRLNDHIRQFAIAYGVLPIASDLVPCQLIQAEATEVSIRSDALSLARRLGVPLPDVLLSRNRSDSRALLLEWQSVALRFGQGW